ncbi:hypothetical protein SELMODRAFT_417243 [Selaginella moellendorffii]|uniref:protein-tyrosine-phosphatase n=1 Tax=Selaginella moellendorffii TaxID=88036 RepID=D8S2K7_SELML|nr:hypothetical protein SELMODRAFT_417243 [Selaginella moellendorffii]
MKKVRDGLYIGSAEDAEMFLCGEKRGVTHILSLEKVRDIRLLKKERRRNRDHPKLSKLQQALLDSSKPKPDDEAFRDVARELLAKCKDAAVAKPVRKVFLLEDTMEEDLLACLGECLDFVEKGREDGIVLVHCGAGISRSAAVITAYLMRKENLLRDEALASLRECSPQVSPNDNFMLQLQIFENAGCVCGGKKRKMPDSGRTDAGNTAKTIGDLASYGELLSS